MSRDNKDQIPPTEKKPYGQLRNIKSLERLILPHSAQPYQLSSINPILGDPPQDPNKFLCCGDNFTFSQNYAQNNDPLQ